MNSFKKICYILPSLSRLHGRQQCKARLLYQFPDLNVNSPLIWNYQAYVYYTPWEFGGISKTRPQADDFLYSHHTSPWLWWMDSVRRRNSILNTRGIPRPNYFSSRTHPASLYCSCIHTYHGVIKMSSLQAKPNPSLPSFIASKSFFCISLNDEYEGKESWLKLYRKKKRHLVETCFEGRQILQRSFSKKKCFVFDSRDTWETALSNDVMYRDPCRFWLVDWYLRAKI